MKVSVVMVTLNAGEVINGALQSLAAQTWPEIELVVVDGGSTDHTLAVLAQHRSLQAKLLQGPDSGIYDAMNKGVAAATGDALFFLNADDRLAQPSALAQLVSAMQQTAADLVFGDVLICGAQADHYRSHHRVGAHTLGYEPLSHQAVLARRSAFDTVGTFDTRWRVCADLDWFMRCARAGLHLHHLGRLVCHCLDGGFGQQHYALQLVEVRQLRRTHHSALQRLRLRAASALHRRLQPWGAPQAVPPPGRQSHGRQPQHSSPWPK